MTIFSNVLGRTCLACGQERKKKDMLGYHPASFEPYCVSPYLCNEDHPNSPINCAKSGKVVQLLSYDEAREAYNTWIEETHTNPERVKRIRRMVEHPSTLRIGDPDLAEFILNLQSEMQFTSIADTIRFCIQRMKEEHGGFHQAVAEKKQEIKEEENLQKVVAAPIPANDEDWSF